MADFSNLQDPAVALAYAARDMVRDALGVQQSDEIEVGTDMSPPENAGPFFIRIHGVRANTIRHPGFVLHQSCGFSATVSVRSRGFPKDIMGIKLAGGSLGAKWLADTVSVILHQNYSLLDAASGYLAPDHSRFFIPLSCDFQMELQDRQHSWWGGREPGVAGASCTVQFSGAEIVRDVRCLRQTMNLTG